MTGRRALFLDRDGVINVDHGYVGTRDRFQFMPGIFPLVRRAVAGGYLPVVVTNQSGIARGFFSESDFRSLSEWMCGRFAQEGAPLGAVYYCPYHPEAPIERWRAEHPWRKPGPGMLLAAARDMALNPTASIMIGDKQSDLDAARSAGVDRLFLLGSEATPHDASVSVIRSLAQAEALLDS